LEKDELIKEYTTKKQAGYSISNFVNTLTHENYILKSQIDLYLNYISFFHISQQKQIKRLYDNYVNFEKELDSNISSEHAFSFDDLVEENMFDELHLDSDIKVEEIEKPETLEPITDTVPSQEDNTLQSEEKKEIPEFKGL
jgi:ankyrin repeat protein